MEEKIDQILLTNFKDGDWEEARKQLLLLFSVIGRSEQLVAFLKWVGDGYDFENTAEKIVKEYIDEGN